jgi:hypothetical protein
MARKVPNDPHVVGDSQIVPSTSVRNLGLTIDRHNTMEQHVRNVCRIAYWQLKNISRLRHFLDRVSLESVVHAFVTSKLDYCNSLLIGLPYSLLNRLQRIQNTAARIITATPKYEHITPVLRELHWLSVEKRVVFKILLLVFKAIHKIAPNLHSRSHRGIYTIPQPKIIQSQTLKGAIHIIPTCAIQSF